MTHFYKDFQIVNNGTKEYPWNIYAMRYNPYLKRGSLEHVGYDKTLRACKRLIDDRCFDDEDYIK
jgi:hypothetical protein